MLVLKLGLVKGQLADFGLAIVGLHSPLMEGVKQLGLPSLVSQIMVAGRYGPQKQGRIQNEIDLLHYLKRLASLDGFP